MYEWVTFISVLAFVYSAGVFIFRFIQARAFFEENPTYVGTERHKKSYSGELWNRIVRETKIHLSIAIISGYTFIGCIIMFLDS